MLYNLPPLFYNDGRDVSPRRRMCLGVKKPASHSVNEAYFLSVQDTKISWICNKPRDFIYLRQYAANRPAVSTSQSPAVRTHGDERNELTMKNRKRIPAILLTASMALSMLTPAWAAESGRDTRGSMTGSVQATVRFDYGQQLPELLRRGISAELFRGTTSLGSLSLTDSLNAGGSLQLGGYPVSVSLRDRQGGEHIGSADPGALDLSVGSLPAGNYSLLFTGLGYTPCSAQFTLADYNQYIEVGTGDGTFALGDVDGNGKITAADRSALAAALGSTSSRDLARCDLNGDGQIDITDLAYINHNANIPTAQPIVKDTSSFTAWLDLSQAQTELNTVGTSVQGSLADLLQEDTPAVMFENQSGGDEIQIPVPLVETVETEYLQILTPDGTPGTILEGSASIEYEGGAGPILLPFSNAAPQGAHAISRTPGSSVITIPLGRRVAVKKITITVTKTESGSYAAVETIRFLKDIVDENLSQPNSEVKQLSASAGDSQVSLTWRALPNVSGYRVEYWPKGQENLSRRLQVDVPKAQVTGLDNLKTYCFTVIPVDDGWQGQPCPEVEATPQPAKRPDAPDMVNVTPLDGQLQVSWKSGKNATYYKVYYTDVKDAPTSSYRQAGQQVTGTTLTITGLTNGTTYYIYIISGNGAGESGPSRISFGTPVATDYSRPEGIPTEGILDPSRIKSIALADPSNYSSSQYPNGSFSIQNVIDNDFRTHWTAKDWSHNEHIVVTFTQPTDLYSVIWVPRLDGTYPHNLRAYSVQVWYEGEDLNGAGHLLTDGVDNGGTGNDSDVLTWPNIPNFSDIPTCKFAVLPFDPVKNVVKISVAAEQKNYTIVSLSELLFMEYDPARCLPDNIAALFADELRTQLTAGVTQADIDALKARLDSDEINYYLNPKTLADELDLAQELLDTKVSGGVVLRGIQSRSSGVDSAKYSQGGSDLQPLGAAARAGQEITVYATGIPEGEHVTLYASQFNAEASAWRAQIGTLTNGRNILTVPTIGSQATERGGSLYLTYSGSNPEAIQLHVRRAVDIPVLELSDWYGLDESARRTRIGAYVDELTAYVSAQNITSANAAVKSLNVTEISTPTVLLSLPAAAVLGANSADRSGRIENLYQNVLAWEDIMHICKTTQGINNTYDKNDMTSRQNIRCMQMFSGAFMYAAGSHIGIGYGSCSGMVSGLPIAKLPAGATANSLFGWGIAHEIGHNMDKLGRAEITNNIYSIMVQTFDGKDNTFASRLEKSGKYPAIFTKTAQRQPGESNDVFVQLGMYWQLHLAYDGKKNDAHGPMWFYNQFFQDWKADTYTAGAQSYDDKVALTAAGVVQKDLTEFFERWGMSLSDAAKEKLKTYGKEDRALWYLSDQSRRERLAGTKPATGTLTAAAQLKGDNVIEITVTPTITGKVQGFEIIRNGKSIAFVLPGEDGAVRYEDVIGSANHRTYQYQAVAYDILGNQIGEAADAGEVRVAYDKLVDPSAYKLTRSGNAATFQFTEPTSISGLKLTGASRPASGAYKITVEASFTDENKKTVERTVTAREGSFDAGNQAVDDQNSYLTYFQKPGAVSDDTRIWTYDAKTLTVTGIPAEMADSDIRPVSYAGDDVAFWEPGAVGRLSADYRYGDGADDVIPKDTLVIVGTYRGDPRFNIVKVMGRFTTTTDSGEQTTVEREVDGEAIMFAEIPGDNQVSDISDGLFIFVPNVQREAELQKTEGEETVNRCDGVNLLPSQMKAILSRTDLPDEADFQRVTAETLWISSPGGDNLPIIVLEGEDA